MRVARVLIGVNVNLGLMNLPGEGREDTPSSGRRSKGVGGGPRIPWGRGCLWRRCIEMELEVPGSGVVQAELLRRQGISKLPPVPFPIERSLDTVGEHHAA